jgi:hypothetical protein
LCVKAICYIYIYIYIVIYLYIFIFKKRRGWGAGQNFFSKIPLPRLAMEKIKLNSKPAILKFMLHKHNLAKNVSVDYSMMLSESETIYT